MACPFRRVVAVRPVPPNPGGVHSVSSPSGVQVVSEVNVILLLRIGSPNWSVSVALTVPEAPSPSSEADSNFTSLVMEIINVVGTGAASDHL